MQLITAQFGQEPK